MKPIIKECDNRDMSHSVRETQGIWNRSGTILNFSQPKRGIKGKNMKVINLAMDWR